MFRVTDGIHRCTAVPPPPPALKLDVWNGGWASIGVRFLKGLNLLDEDWGGMKSLSFTTGQQMSLGSLSACSVTWRPTRGSEVAQRWWSLDWNSMRHSAPMTSIPNHAWWYSSVLYACGVQTFCITSATLSSDSTSFLIIRLCIFASDVSIH